MSQDIVATNQHMGGDGAYYTSSLGSSHLQQYSGLLNSLSSERCLTV
jgi:hypothetical protein